MLYIQVSLSNCKDPSIPLRKKLWKTPSHEPFTQWAASNVTLHACSFSARISASPGVPPGGIPIVQAEIFCADGTL